MSMDIPTLPLRILVADDNDLMRSGLCNLLNEQPGWQICGEAATGVDAICKSIQLKPDVILLDISMPDLNGFEVARRVQEALPQAEILIVTDHDFDSLAHIGTQRGVCGYVIKSRLSFDLIPAVQAATVRLRLSASVPASA